MKTYAFRCRGGSELKAQATLTGYGLIGRNPVRYEFIRVNKAGVKIIRATPQLQGYYVALIPDDICWHSLLGLTWQDGTRILGKPLSHDGTLRALDPLTVLQIKALQGCDPIEPDIQIQVGIKPGDTVVIHGGLHDGLRTKVKRRKGTTKGVKLSGVIKILGGLREVTFDEANAEIIEAA